MEGIVFHSTIISIDLSFDCIGLMERRGLQLLHHFAGIHDTIDRVVDRSSDLGSPLGHPEDPSGCGCHPRQIESTISVGRNEQTRSMVAISFRMVCRSVPQATKNL